MKIRSFILALCLSSFAFAGPHSSDCIKKFVDLLKQDQFDKAFDAVLDNSPFLMGNINVANVKMQYMTMFQNIAAQYGKPFGFEILGSKTIGTLERTGFLIQCEKNAWVIELTEYNNPEAKKQYIVNIKVIDENDAFARYGL